MVLRPRGRGRVGRRRHLIRNAPSHNDGAFRFSGRPCRPTADRQNPDDHPTRPRIALLSDMHPSRATLIGAGATVAAVLGVLVRREQSRRTTERFAAAALETLLNAIDANDDETGAHVRRVAQYALILADAAELSEHECKSIERVALFHDIGKIHEALFDIVREP